MTETWEKQFSQEKIQVLTTESDGVLTNNEK